MDAGGTSETKITYMTAWHGCNFKMAFLTGLTRCGWPSGPSISALECRTVEQKKALYGRIVERLGKNPGLRPQDIFLNLLEVAKENWSFGNGEAQYA